MTRKVMFVDDEPCARCGGQDDTQIKLKDIEINEDTNKHTEYRECTGCGAEGTVEFTPPDGTYKLSGKLYEKDN